MTRTLIQPPEPPKMQHPPRQRLSSNAVLVSCELNMCEIANAVTEVRISPEMSAHRQQYSAKLRKKESLAQIHKFCVTGNIEKVYEQPLHATFSTSP